MLKQEGEKMLVECKSFLDDVKQLERLVLEWIAEFGAEHLALTEKLEQDLLKKLRGHIETLEQMEPGIIVEVI